MTPFGLGLLVLILVGAPILWLVILTGAAILRLVDQARPAPCPYCRKKISRAAVNCPHCQSALGPEANV
jgi:hypothetical protein